MFATETTRARPARRIGSPDRGDIDVLKSIF